MTKFEATPGGGGMNGESRISESEPIIERVFSAAEVERTETILDVDGCRETLENRVVLYSRWKILKEKKGV